LDAIYLNIKKVGLLRLIVLNDIEESRLTMSFKNTFIFLVAISSNFSIANEITKKEAGVEITPVNVSEYFHKKMVPERTIDLGRSFYTVRLAFSPNSGYLAIGDQASPNIIVWDLKNNVKQTSFYARSSAGIGRNIAHWSQADGILWSPDGRYVTNGVGIANSAGAPIRSEVEGKIEFWDPVSGKVIKEVNAISSGAKLNKSGSKVLISSGMNNEFSIIDTAKWTSKNFKADGILTRAFDWTENDEVVIVAALPGRVEWGRAINAVGEIIDLGSILLHFIDPSGKTAAHNFILSHPLKNINPKLPGHVPFSVKSVASSFTEKKELILFSGFIDGDNNFSRPENGAVAKPVDGILVVANDGPAISFIRFYKDNSLYEIADAGAIFSPDGRFIYLQFSSNQIGVNSLILDSTSDDVVGYFPSTTSGGIAVSPDGKKLAVGRGQYIDIFPLKNNITER